MLRQFFDLGFFPEAEPRKPPLWLGPPKKASRQQIMWELASWILLTLGIFLRQGLVFAPLGWTLDRLGVGAFLASAAIALAVFPIFMRWLNEHKHRPGLLHIASPFAFGFFLDLAKVSVLRLPGALRRG